MAVFDELRRAWREAVENFWQELEGADHDERSRRAYGEVAGVRNQLGELDDTMSETRHRLAHELEQVERCTRRERMARNIGDEETARIAAEYRARHRERADVLRRKLDALDAERRLCARDLGEMERALQEVEEMDLDQHPREREFRTLEESERSRSAAERLQELKQKMQQ